MSSFRRDVEKENATPNPYQALTGNDIRSSQYSFDDPTSPYGGRGFDFARLPSKPLKSQMPIDAYALLPEQILFVLTARDSGYDSAEIMGKLRIALGGNLAGKDNKVLRSTIEMICNLSQVDATTYDWYKNIKPKPVAPPAPPVNKGGVAQMVLDELAAGKPALQVATEVLAMYPKSFDVGTTPAALAPHMDLLAARCREVTATRRN